jgi:flagellar capping protein FliD
MVGFSLGTDGQLSLDAGVFGTALAEHPDGVIGLFSAITDVALASNGGSFSSSPAAEAGFSAAGLINGNTDSDDFGTGNGFQSLNALGAGDVFEIQFGRTRQISQLVLNNINSAALGLPSGTFGVRDFSFELRSPSGVWSTVKSVSGFTGEYSFFSLEQPTLATAMRVTVTATNAADGKVRLVELSANEEEGVAHKIGNLLDSVTRSVDGQIATEQSALDSKIESLTKQIEDMQSRLDAKELLLRKQFTDMETAMSRMQSQAQQFSATLSGTSWATG